MHESVQVISEKQGANPENKSMTLTSLSVRRLRTCEKPDLLAASPRLGKRELQQRRSRTLACMDDTETVKRKQRPMTIKGRDELKVHVVPQECDK